jgi:dCTP deaminase
MGFWSSETLMQRVFGEKLIEPYNHKRVKYGAYELTLGRDAFVSSSPSAVKKTLEVREQITIPPGQLGLLISAETVRIPDDAIGFISIKAGAKLGGLINVSGFHVDPGFIGQLKFSVYNAGAEPIVLEEAQPLFLIWFSELDRATEDLYDGRHKDQHGITSGDVQRLQGDLPSPAALKKEIEALKTEHEKKITSLETRFVMVVTLLGTLVIGFFTTCARERAGGQPNLTNNIEATQSGIEASQSSGIR